MVITDIIHTSLLNEDAITYRVVLPSDVQKTCLWLHGYREWSDNLLLKSNLEQLAEEHKIAILLPDVPDTYYLDQPWNKTYTEQFLISEFLPSVTSKYHLPFTKNDTFIAGISMGGFGSLLLGSHFCDLFSKIACISGAFIINDILIGNPEIVGTDPNILTHFQNLFGDIPSLETSYSRNPELAATHAARAHQLPPVFVSCGTEDMLYSRNTKIRDQLISSGANVTWAENAGNHNFKYFNHALENAFHWFISDHS